MSSSPSSEERPAVPRGWVLAGSDPEDYDCGAEPGRAFLRSKPEPKGFGTLMQTFTADRYRGRRWVLSASLSTDRVTDWCGLWMRVDGPGGRTLAFDNMEDRRVTGTRGPEAHRVVLDVADGAKYVAFGVLLSGSGAVWIADVSFDEAPDGTPVTGGDRARPDAPVNLGFE